MLNSVNGTIIFWNCKLSDQASISQIVLWNINVFWDIPPKCSTNKNNIKVKYISKCWIKVKTSDVL